MRDVHLMSTTETLFGPTLKFLLKITELRLKMSSTLSVSKGCFVFKNKTSGKENFKYKTESGDDELCEERWFSAYKQTLKWLEDKIQALHSRSLSTVLDGLVSFIATAHEDSESSKVPALPAAALLTGINMPDHESLFCTLSATLREKATPHVAVLYARKCNTLNAAMEQMFFQFMNSARGDCKEDSGERRKTGDSVESSMSCRKLRMHSLQLWYRLQLQDEAEQSCAAKRARLNQGQGKQPLVVVVPDFEKFSGPVLQDLLLILSGACKLPFIVVLGVATSIASVHRMLPHCVTARLCLKVLHAPPSLDLLSLLLDEVVFAPECPLRLGSRIFNFLIDVFLCCDLSVRGFVHALKFCLAEHMSGQPWKVLCCAPRHLEASAEMLTAEDVRALRQLPSFQRFLSTLEASERERLLTNDAFMKVTSVRLLRELHISLSSFHCALQCLCTLTAELPQQPLGSQVRQVYGQAVGTPLWQTAQYKACFRLLGFLSRQELVSKVRAVCTLLRRGSSEALIALAAALCEHIEQLERAAAQPKPDVTSPEKRHSVGTLRRHTLKEDLLAAHRAPPAASAWEAARARLLEFLAWEALPQMLSPPAERPLAELVFFEGLEGGARTHIAATPRSALHIALHHPHSYLQCSCCSSESASTVPDIVVAHRLYKECGRFINLFDWLQAFAALTNPDSPNEGQIDNTTQARFTRALAELQFLGFIKTSSRKVDHVVKASFDSRL